MHTKRLLAVIAASLLSTVAYAAPVFNRVALFFVEAFEVVRRSRSPTKLAGDRARLRAVEALRFCCHQGNDESCFVLIGEYRECKP